MLRANSDSIGKDSLTPVVHDMLLGALYATSACVMFGATVYFAVKRGETFEAAQRITGPVSFIVKYSRNGEPVNLYLRLGLALIYEICESQYLKMFAAMSIGQSSIRLHEMQEQKSMHWPEVFKTVFEISFFIAQTFFILIYHRSREEEFKYFGFGFLEFKLRVIYLAPDINYFVN
ncbi:hypothetical protein ACTXT7_008857 [Hymenolepis weldensis]